MSPDDLPQWDPYEASIENFEREQEEKRRQTMKKNKIFSQWEEHMSKFWQFSDMIIQDIRTFYQIYERGYDDKLVDAVLEKLKVDLDAFVREYNETVGHIEIVPRVDPPTSFVRVEDNPPYGKGWYTTKFTCPDCSEEMTVVGSSAESCSCSIWRVDIGPNKALRIDRSPLGLV